LTAHRKLARRTLAALLAATFTACGSGRDEPTPAEPIAGLEPGNWTWVPFPDTACQDGSPTGLAVSAGTGPDLVLFLNGGGACWDFLTCEVLALATRGPFGEAEFEALRAGVLPGSILDRTLPGNPFADATLVFVPYCTGDVHAGDRVATYTGTGGPATYLHVGRPNLQAFLRRLAVTWPAPRRLVVSGASAGGFGALLEYDAVRRRWPAAQGFLVDDSGPPLGEGAISPALLAAWREAWGIDPLLEPLCGPACETAFGPALGAVAARWPEDRLAILSSLRDSVIAGYFQLPAAAFEGHLRAMARDLVAPLPNARVFLVPGEQHTMLGAPPNFTQGVPLLDWLSAQVGGGAWDSQLPPEAP
jgi:hypothetical protein